MSDLLSSAVYNLDTNKGRFQRQLVYKNIPENIAKEFQALSSKKSQELLIELNNWLASKANNENREKLSLTAH